VKTGGGLLQAATGAGIMTSTFSGNQAVTGGGAIATYSTSLSHAATITWSTIVGNSSTTSGSGGIQRFDMNTTAFEIGSTIVAQQHQRQRLAAVQQHRADHVRRHTTSRATRAAAPPRPLRPEEHRPAARTAADNGGPTLTHLPNAGSTAIDNAATPADCPLVDQRGVAADRPGL